MEKCYLLFSLCNLLPSFVIQPKTICPGRGSASHSGLGPSTSTINQENDPTDLPTSQCDRVIVPSEVSSSQMALICVKLTKDWPTQFPLL